MRISAASFALAVASLLACGSSKTSGEASGGGDSGAPESGGSSGGSSGSSSGSSGGSSGSSSGSGGGNGCAGSSVQFTRAVTITVEPGDDAQGLITAIENAKTSVHMEMYLLSNSAVISALLTQHKAGREVKVILNKTFPPGSSDNTSSYGALQAAGVDVVWAPAGYTYTHEKGVIIDGTSAWIMTMNAAQSSPTVNREYLALDTDAADVAEAEAIFEHDLANQSYTPKGKLVVSPNNSRTALMSFIQLATTSIDMEAEELTDSSIVGALEAAAGRGLKVRVVLADAQSTSDSAGLKAAGVELVTYSALYVHAKAIVVDGHCAYVGSENFSAGSLSYNRELGILTDTASEVQKVESTTSSDFAAGAPL